MFTRKLVTPHRSIFLFGPRGTGKSTWIRERFPLAQSYDLLNTGEALRLSREPGFLFRELSSIKPGSWVVIDEVQKVPLLLDEVHRLIEEKRLKFVLSGSSARKLRRGGVNLLAGRAQTERLFPLVSSEVGFHIDPRRVLRFGLLPHVFQEPDAMPYLRTYAETYLQEEIKSEALTRTIGAFSRFLEVAARQNGQVTNVSNISRDAMVARQTVQGYFDILVDTLVGSWLKPWKLKRATKQVAHPKFYFFDSGVVRALSGRLPYPPVQEELGSLLETWILHELEAYVSYTGVHYPLFFWRSHGGVEIDFFCETKRGYVAIECKVSSQWRRGDEKGLVRIGEELGVTKVNRIGIYLGERAFEQQRIKIMPVILFLKKLWFGEIL